MRTIVITTVVQNETTGKRELVASHGVVEDTLESVVLQCVHPSLLGAVRDQSGHWVIDNGADDGNAVQGEVQVLQNAPREASGQDRMACVSRTAGPTARDDRAAAPEEAETYMNGFPPHQFGPGDDPRCMACGERRDYIERARRPCLATPELRAKLWHDGIAVYGLRAFGEPKPVAIPEKPPAKSKKSATPSLF